MEVLRSDFAKMLSVSESERSNPYTPSKSELSSKLTQLKVVVMLASASSQDTVIQHAGSVFKSLKAFLSSTCWLINPPVFDPFSQPFPSQVAGASYQYVLRPLGSAAAAAGQAVYSYVLRPLPGRAGHRCLHSMARLCGSCVPNLLDG